MHVSLNRRSHRVGRSLQYLLWICFGLLAVVPIRMIQGQDEPSKPRVRKKNDKPLSRSDQQIADRSRTDEAKKRQKSVDDPLVPVTYRSQTAPPGPSSQDMGTPVLGPQETGPFAYSRQDTGFMSNERLTGRSGQAYGVQFSASAITGPGVGRVHSIFPVQMMPYAFTDNTLVFTDIRGFTNTESQFGGNFGGGVRQYLPAFDRILGGNVFYDYDTTSGATFRELGVGFESLGAMYDIRANGYLPMGVTAQQLSLNNVDGSQRFVGHNLLVDQAKVVGNALQGFDAEIGVPLPGAIAQRHDIRAFGGGYWFQGSLVPAFAGWKIRAQGNVTPNISLNLQVSNDQQFKTNVVFGATIHFGGYKPTDGEIKNQYSRMTTPVLRSYNINVARTTEIIPGVEVINPATGNPYFIEHVASYAPGPTHDGTVEHPFLTVADAQAIPVKDIIFVHANSTYSGVQVALQDNVRVLGEASNVQHVVNTNGGSLLLPHVTTGVAVRPIFTNSPGNGVNLANNSEFSGFQIGNSAVAGSGPAGVGIFGSGISNATVRQTDVSFSGAQGVVLNNTGGTISFLGDVINSPSTASTAVQVTGTQTQGTVIFGSDPLTLTANPTPGVINNTAGGLALLVDGTAKGSIVDFTGGTINDSKGLGIQITNDAGQFNLGNATLTNDLQTALNILNDSGQITGQGKVTISGANGDAINIQNLAAGGFVDFIPTAAININNRVDRGINLLNNAGSVSILSPVIIAATGNVALPAIEYSGSTGNATFGNITIANGGPGIVIDPSAAGVTDSGVFSVTGATIINAPAGNAITVTNVDSNVTFNTLTINNRGAVGVEILNTRSPVSFIGVTTIANTAAVPTAFPAVDIRGNAATANVSFQNLSITGAAGPSALGAGVNLGGIGTDVNPGQVSFSILNVTSTNGIGLKANNVGVTTTTPPTGGIIIGAGAISSTNSGAIDIQNSALRATLTSVISTNAPQNGINLRNNTPFNNSLASALANYSFTVTGNVTGRGSGGTISGAGGAGVNLENTGGVSLAAMNINNNHAGIIALNTLRLTVANMGLNNNATVGIFGTNVAEVDISNSTFNLNGTTGAGNAIHLTANAILPQISPTNGNYIWNILNNTALNGFNGAIITPANGGDAVLIDNTARLQDPVTGLTTPLVLSFNGNSVFVNAPVTNALSVNWIGPESGNININNINLTGFNTGFSISNSDLNFLTNFNLFGNTLNAVGGGNIGINVNNQGPTDLFIGNLIAANGTITPSTFTFNQLGGNVLNNADIGMKFVTGKGSDLDIFSNSIIMTSGGSPDQALVFQFLQAPTTVTISNNIFTVDDRPLAPFSGQGIEFLATNGAVRLNGALNNIVTINGLQQSGFPWVFVSSAAATTGSFTVNNFQVP